MTDAWQNGRDLPAREKQEIKRRVEEVTPGPLATLKHLSSGMLTPFGIAFMAVGSFKKGDFQLSAQVSAVAVQAGASANAKYRDGIAVFAIAKGNFTYEASVGGQKFTFKPKK